jgi:hypothetical protein
LEDLGIDGRIILKLILYEMGGGGMDGIALAGDRTIGGAFKCGNEPSGFMEIGEFHD